MYGVVFSQCCYLHWSQERHRRFSLVTRQRDRRFSLVTRQRDRRFSLVTRQRDRCFSLVTHKAERSKLLIGHKPVRTSNLICCKAAWGRRISNWPSIGTPLIGHVAERSSDSHWSGPWRMENKAMSFLHKLLLIRVWGGGVAPLAPTSTQTHTLTSRFRNYQCKDDSVLFSRFLHGQDSGWRIGAFDFYRVRYCTMWTSCSLKSEPRRSATSKQ